MVPCVYPILEIKALEEGGEPWVQGRVVVEDPLIVIPTMDGHPPKADGSKKRPWNPFWN